METITSDDIIWSPQKTQHLQDQLVDSWSEDIWKLNGESGSACYLRFHLTSPALRTEIKYAIWHKFHTKAWNEEKDVSRLRARLNHLVVWLNGISPNGASLLEKRLEYWEWSLRSHLIEMGLFKQWKGAPGLRANQVYVTYLCEDRRISLLRQIYATLQKAYDDRPILERDIWDMCQLGLPVNLTNSNYLLNFTSIVQPWLRSLAKTFMRYRIAIASPADCSNKLWALHIFSRFLAQDFPQCTPKDIRRDLIVRYISELRIQSKLVDSFRQALVHLRVFLETCTQHLKVQGLSKERRYCQLGNVAEHCAKITA
ncbi:hypothetical protein [Ktedonobacter sp. SOSP1-85]|uniref:hypothetical protein n=1 Tax=Ktedonobacter sp. SOSP1-85 TaxID=2778367 RepID=UPI001916AD02|nr:hypothetical protein [Ktedonobacter sp. SOSP1-85]